MVDHETKDDGRSRSSARNAAIGRRVRAVRKSAGETQAGLAEAMRRRGHAWTENTVYQIESGRQPIRGLEVVDAADELGVQTVAILDGPVHDDVLAVHGLLREYEYHSRSIRAAVFEYERYRLRLARVFDNAIAVDDAADDPRVREAAWIVSTPVWDVARLDGALLYESQTYARRPDLYAGDETGDRTRGVLADLDAASQWKSHRDAAEADDTNRRESDHGKR